MSYEGYEQMLCANGHYHEFDCYDLPGDNWRCNDLVHRVVCNAPIKVTNDVDDTNCNSYGRRKLIELSPEKNAVCSMGHSHVTHSATYKLSSTRYYFDAGSGKDGQMIPFCEDSSIND